MNILLDNLPEYITVGGEKYFADTDFRTMIIFEKIIRDQSIDNARRVRDVIDLILTDKQPVEIDLAIDEILYLYSCGDNSKGSIRPNKNISKRRPMNGDVELKPKLIYDYEHDAPYIYAAFLSQYCIDLNEIPFLHWWKFQALFRSLDDNCKISQIMGYRAVDIGKVTDKKEKDRIARLKRIYALEDEYTFEDKVAMAGMAFR